MAGEPELVLGGDLNGSQTAPEAPRITLGSNLFVEAVQLLQLRFHCTERLCHRPR